MTNNYKVHFLHRVEGQGKAVITDVIYSSKESSNDELTTTGSKEELERIKVWTGVLYVVCALC